MFSNIYVTIQLFFLFLVNGVYFYDVTVYLILFLQIVDMDDVLIYFFINIGKQFAEFSPH